MGQHTTFDQVSPVSSRDSLHPTLASERTLDPPLTRRTMPRYRSSGGRDITIGGTDITQSVVARIGEKLRGAASTIRQPAVLSVCQLASFSRSPGISRTAGYLGTGGTVTPEATTKNKTQLNDKPPTGRRTATSDDRHLSIIDASLTDYAPGRRVGEGSGEGEEQLKLESQSSPTRPRIGSRYIGNGGTPAVDNAQGERDKLNPESSPTRDPNWVRGTGGSGGGWGGGGKGGGICGGGRRREQRASYNELTSTSPPSTESPIVPSSMIVESLFTKPYEAYRRCMGRTSPTTPLLPSRQSSPYRQSSPSQQPAPARTPSQAKTSPFRLSPSIVRPSSVSYAIPSPSLLTQSVDRSPSPVNLLPSASPVYGIPSPVNRSLSPPTVIRSPFVVNSSLLPPVRRSLSPSPVYGISSHVNHRSPPPPINRSSPPPINRPPFIDDRHPSPVDHCTDHRYTTWDLAEESCRLATVEYPESSSSCTSLSSRASGSLDLRNQDQGHHHIPSHGTHKNSNHHSHHHRGYRNWFHQQEVDDYDEEYCANYDPGQSECHQHRLDKNNTVYNVNLSDFNADSRNLLTATSMCG